MAPNRNVLERPGSLMSVLPYRKDGFPPYAK